MGALRLGLGSGSGSGGSAPGAAGDHSIPPEICLFWLYRPVWISNSSKLVVLTLDHKFRPSGGRGRAALQLPIGQSGWFTGFVDPMLQLF